MKASWCDLETHYTSALQDYVRSPDEAALHRAYELGRKALDDGLGVLEIAVLYHKALARLLANLRTSEEIVRVAKAAESFFVESLAPFEMTHRAAREANTALLRLNERLEEEAKRIAHSLHDEAGQFLACVHIALEEVARDLPASSGERLREVKKLLDEVEAQLRRLSHELRPTILDDLGLLPALEFLAEGVSKRAGLSITVQGLRDGRLPFSIETALYRIVQEALTNIIKHARATQADIRIWQEWPNVHCSIHDNGIGFNVPAVAARKGEQGLGLIGIRERLEVLGGKLQVNSDLGQGTEMLVMIPLEK